MNDDQKLIDSIISSHPSNFPIIIKSKYPDLYLTINSLSGNSFSEKLYKYKNNVISPPTCIHCNINKTKFISITKGYGKICSKVCASRSNIVKGIESARSQESKDKRKESCLVRYGVDCSAQTKKSIDSLNDFININGHPLKDIDNRSKLVKSRKKKFIERCVSGSRLPEDIIPLFDIESFGGINKKYPFKCKECNSEFSAHFAWGLIPYCKKCHPNSKWEEELMCDIKTYYSGKLSINDQQVLPKNRELDFYFPELKKAVELNGSYWHSNKNGKVKDYHSSKQDMCDRLGIKLIQIYEFDWIEDVKYIKNNIKNFILNNLVQFDGEQILSREEENLYDLTNKKIIKSVGPRKIYLNKGKISIDKTTQWIYDAGKHTYANS